MQSKVLSAAAVLAALLVALAAPAVVARHPAAAATATPVALAYDEITRMIVPPATPPAPGSFQVDYQAIVGAGNAATPAPHKRGFGALVGAVMSGAVPGAGSGDQTPVAEAMQRMRLGHLVRITNYKGWLRTDDPVTRTATISKCREHQFITLDLAKKTYTIAQSHVDCGPSEPMPGARSTVVEREQPGTADTTIDVTRSNLGPLTIDTIGTAGYDDALEVSTVNASGSCRNGESKIGLEQYVSKVAIPRRFCPLPKTMESPTDYVVRGGCKPTLHTHGDPASLTTLDLLVMFSKMTFSSSESNSGPAGMAMITERGNVKWLSGPDADALFTIPPGFSQSQ